MHSGTNPFRHLWGQKAAQCHHSLAAASTCVILFETWSDRARQVRWPKFLSVAHALCVLQKHIERSHA